MASPETLVELLRRELEASRSVSEHIAFLGRLLQDPVPDELKQALMHHIGEEEAEHQAHLGRLLPALEGFIRQLEAAPSPLPSTGEGGRFTVGGLTQKRPRHAG